MTYACFQLTIQQVQLTNVVMNIFVVCHASNIESLEARVKKAFPKDYYTIGIGVWLIAAPLTAQDVSTALEIGPGNHGVVISMANYWGHAEPNLWEWIKVRLENVRA